MSAPLVTVFVPTFNGECYLAEILDAVYRQDSVFDFEVVVIDSGSTDGTLSILREYRQLRLIEILNTEFQHGRTRNLAAHDARGQFVAYLTQTATPAHSRWLQMLIRHFLEDERVAGTDTEVIGEGV